MFFHRLFPRVTRWHNSHNDSESVGLKMGDKEAIKKLQEKIRATVRRQVTIKEAAELAVTEVDARERQERT